MKSAHDPLSLAVGVGHRVKGTISLIVDITASDPPSQSFGTCRLSKLPCKSGKLSSVIHRLGDDQWPQEGTTCGRSKLNASIRNGRRAT